MVRTGSAIADIPWHEVCAGFEDRILFAIPAESESLIYCVLVWSKLNANSWDPTIYWNIREIFGVGAF